MDVKTFKEFIFKFNEGFCFFKGALFPSCSQAFISNEMQGGHVKLF